MSVRSFAAVAACLCLPTLAGCALGGPGGADATAALLAGGSGVTGTGASSGTPNTGTGNTFGFTDPVLTVQVMRYNDEDTTELNYRGLSGFNGQLNTNTNGQSGYTFLSNAGFSFDDLSQSSVTADETIYSNANGEMIVRQAGRTLGGAPQILQHGFYGIYDFVEQPGTTSAQREAGSFFLEGAQSNGVALAANGPQAVYTGRFIGRLQSAQDTTQYLTQRLEGNARIDLDFNTATAVARISDLTAGTNAVPTNFDLYGEHFLSSTGTGIDGSMDIVRVGATAEDVTFAQTTDSDFDAEFLGPNGEEIYGTTRVRANSTAIITGRSDVDVYGSFGTRKQ